MDKKIEGSLRGIIAGIAVGKAGHLEESIQPGPELLTFYSQLKEVFDRKVDFLTKLHAFDDLFEQQSIFAPQQELLFVCLLLIFFAGVLEGFVKVYLRNPEWKGMERGS